MPTASTLKNRLLNKARLRHLLVFVRVADLQSVNRAAQAVGVSQPTATQALMDLESLLEVTLFLRHAQGMTLTPAGAALIPSARRILGLVDDTASQAAAIAQGSQTIVRTAAISAAISGPLARVAPGFAQAHPEVILQLQEANFDAQTHLIADGDIDCAICRAPTTIPSGWTYTPLWHDRFAIVANPQHPLAHQTGVQLAQLLEATWLVTPTSLAARQAFDEHFDSQTPHLRKYNVVTTSASMIMSILEREPLLVLLPHSLGEQALSTGRLVEIQWDKTLALGTMGMLVPNTKPGVALDKWTRYLARDQGPSTDPA